MYIRGKIDAFPEGSLIKTHSSDLAVFLFDNGILSLKYDGATFYYPKTDRIKKLIKHFAKEGGSTL